MPRQSSGSPRCMVRVRVSVRLRVRVGVRVKVRVRVRVRVVLGRAPGHHLVRLRGTREPAEQRA